MLRKPLLNILASTRCYTSADIDTNRGERQFLLAVKVYDLASSQVGLSESESGYLSQLSIIMAIPSGEYIIENARNHNWVILRNANEDEDVIAGTYADENAGHKVNQFVIFISMEYRDSFSSTVVHQKTPKWNILSSKPAL
jgi:hypothetical protein